MEDCGVPTTRYGLFHLPCGSAIGFFGHWRWGLGETLPRRTSVLMTKPMLWKCLRWMVTTEKGRPNRTAPETRRPGASVDQSNCEILQFAVLGFDLLVQLDQPLADLDAGQQFRGVKRLGEVVICAGRPVSRKHSLPLSNHPKQPTAFAESY